MSDILDSLDIDEDIKKKAREIHGKNKEEKDEIYRQLEADPVYNETYESLKSQIQPLKEQQALSKTDKPGSAKNKEKDRGFTLFDRTPGELIDDTAVSLAKGLATSVDVVSGLLDMTVTRGQAGKLMDDIGYDSGKITKDLEKYYSTAQKEAFENVREEDSFWGTVGAVVKNPSVALHTAVESGPIMYGGSLLGKGGLKIMSKVAPKVVEKAGQKLARTIAASAGEGLTISGLVASDIRKGKEGDHLTAKDSAFALGAGLTGGAFGYAGGRIAQSLGVADPDTLLLGISENLTSKHVAKRIITGGITEGVFEELPQEVQETMWVNAALEKPLWEGTGHAGALGMFAGGTMGAGSQLVRVNEREQAQEDPRIQTLRKITEEPDNPSVSIGTALSGMTTTESNETIKNLNNTRDPEARRKAVDKIEKSIIKTAETPEIGKQRAEVFANNALSKIENEEDIEIDQDVVSFASMPQQDQNEYVRDTLIAQVDASLEQLYSKMENIKKFKVKTFKQQEKLDELRRDMSNLVKGRKKLESWDISKEIQPEAFGGKTEDLKEELTEKKTKEQDTVDIKQKSAVKKTEKEENQAEGTEVDQVDEDTGLAVPKPTIQEEAENTDKNLSSSFSADTESDAASAFSDEELEALIRGDEETLSENTEQVLDTEMEQSLAEEENVRGEQIKEEAKNKAFEQMYHEAKDTQSKTSQEDEDGNIIWSGASSPQWMKDLNAKVSQDLKKKGEKKRIFNRKEIDTLLKKHINGEVMTEKQAERFAYLDETAEEISNADPEFAAQEEADTLQQKGYTVTGPEEVTVADFDIGDKIYGTIDGVEDEYRLIGYDEQNGEAIFQDGIKRQVDVFDRIEIKGFIQAPENQKTEAQESTEIKNATTDTGKEIETGDIKPEKNTPIGSEFLPETTEGARESIESTRDYSEDQKKKAYERMEEYLEPGVYEKAIEVYRKVSEALNKRTAQGKANHTGGAAYVLNLQQILAKSAAFDVFATARKEERVEYAAKLMKELAETDLSDPKLNPIPEPSDKGLTGETKVGTYYTNKEEKDGVESRLVWTKFQEQQEPDYWESIDKETGLSRIGSTKEESISVLKKHVEDYKKTQDDLQNKEYTEQELKDFHQRKRIWFIRDIAEMRGINNFDTAQAKTLIREILQQQKDNAKKSDDGSIGTNPEGKKIFVDEKGVRSYQDGNVRVKQSVSVKPTKQGVIADADNVQQLYYKGQTDYLTTEEIQSLKSKRDEAEDIYNSDEDPLVKTNNGEVLGKKEYNGDEDTGFIDLVQVPKSKRGQGFGTELINKAIDLFEKEGKTKVAITTTALSEGKGETLVDSLIEKDRLKTEQESEDILAETIYTIIPKETKKAPKAESAETKDTQPPPKKAKQPDGVTQKDKTSTPNKKLGPDFGKNNKIFQKEDLDEGLKELKEQLNQLNSGLDPKMLKAGLQVTGYYIEGGIRSFTDYATLMIQDLGKAITPYLRTFYESARYYPGLETEGMTPHAEIDKINIDELADSIINQDEAQEDVQEDVQEEAQEESQGVVNLAPNPNTAEGVAYLKFKKGEGYKSISEARKEIGEALGQQIKPGTMEAKNLDEQIELAAVKVAREFVQSNKDKMSQGEIFDELIALQENMPKLGVRTTTSTTQQAYSTPLPMAYVAAELAGITDSDTVFEPSAGNGALLLTASPENIIANEINEGRVEALKSQNFKTVIQEDGASIKSPQTADVIIANPPFGTVKDEAGASKKWDINNSYKTTQIDHAIAFNALESMKSDGKAVFIVGSVNDKITTKKARKNLYRSNKAKVDFYKELYDNYNVVKHFSVSGKMYEKQGAGWPVDIIVIDGKGKSKLEYPVAEPPPYIETFEQLKGELNGKAKRRPDSMDAGRPGIGGRPATVPTVTGNMGTQEFQTNEGEGGEPLVVDNTGTSKPATGQGGGPGTATEQDGQHWAKPAVSGGSIDGSGDKMPTGPNVEHEGSGDVPVVEPVRPGSEQGTDRDESGGRGNTSEPRLGLKSGEPVLSVKKEKPKESEDKTQVEYQPESKSSAIGTLTPRNLQRATNKALQKIIKKHGDLDQFVADKLGYTLEEVIGTEGKRGFFAAEQVDAIALALDNLDSGKGFIIGDQTGGGKGRVVAAMIRFGIQQGTTPIFITDKTNLYSDMYRDLSDIGMSDIADKILVTNSGETFSLTEDGSVKIKTKNNHTSKLKAMTQEGKIDEPYQVIFTTYDQLNGTRNPRRAFFESVGAGGMFILDEAHKAGGSSANRETLEKTPRSIWMRRMLHKAHSAFYSSATFAKRPDVMSLYHRTDMNLAVNDIEELSQAIETGGIPLQQSVSSMLTEAGQYIRRERSYDGVVYETSEVEADVETSNKMSECFAEIKAFSDGIADAAMEAIKDEVAGAGTTATGGNVAGEGQIQSTGFTSIMHNLINQTLLAMKTPPSVEKAIQAHKEGKKPVITLANTMGSFIEKYANEHGLKSGDAINLQFNDLMFNYLQKTREYNVGTGRDAVKEWISDIELGEAGVAEYNRIKEIIYSMDFSKVPVSPIDYAISTLKKEGIKVGEITGREHRIEYKPDGTQIYRKRPGSKKSAAAKTKLLNEFNTDLVDAMILNQSGSTGLSAHAIPKFEGHNPAQRTMILMQPEANIDTHMQMLGRIHRAGQVQKPSYEQVTLDLPTEKRPAAVLAGKMGSLNASTTAAKSGALEAKNVVDFVNKYGDRTAANIMADFPEIHRALGSPLNTSDRTDSGLEELNAVKKVTGRIPLLKTKEEQEEVYNLIESEYLGLIEQLDALGQNDLEAKTYDTDAETKKKATVFQGKGTSPFESAAVAEVVDMKKLGKSYSSDELLGILRQSVYDMGAKEAKKAPQGLIETQEDAKRKKKEASKKPLENYEKYLEEEVGKAKNEEAEAATRKRLDTLKNSWLEVFNSINIGGKIRYSINGDIKDCVVTQVEQKGSPKNPLALGTWKISLAIPDSERKIIISFNNLLKAATIRKKTLSESGIIAGMASDEDLRGFDHATKSAREKRTIITGNLLAAFGKYKKGRIINFTDKDGSVRQGILMPAKFDLEKESSRKKIQMETAEEAFRVLQHGYGLKAPKRDVALTIPDENSYKITVPVSKAKGSIFWQNKELTRIMGAEFIKSGSRYQAYFDSNKAKAVLSYLIDPLGLDVKFENTDPQFNSSIRELLGREEIKLEDVKPDTKFQTSSDYKPGEGVSLDDIKKRFKGQQVFIAKDGSIVVNLKNNSSLKITAVDVFGDGDVQLAVKAGRMDKDGAILGKYQEGVITLNKNESDKAVLDHETYHFLADTILTPSERAVILNKAKAYKKAGKFNYEWQNSNEENEANAFSQFLAEREAHRSTLIGRIIQKITDFLDNLIHIGEASAKKVARQTETGNIYSKPQNKTQERQSEAFFQQQANGRAFSSTLSANDYIGKRAGRKLTEKEKKIRNISYGLKEGNPDDILLAAKEMVDLIPGRKKDTVFIPVPGHDGSTDANLQLAQELANLTGGKVQDIIERKPSESQRQLRGQGKRGQKPDEIKTSFKGKILDKKRVLFVDNVITSGATMRAVLDAAGKGQGLVYAKSLSKGPKFTATNKEASYSTSSDKTDPFSVLPTEAQIRMKQAKIEKRTTMDKISTSLKKIKEETQHFPGLTRIEDVKDRAFYKDILRRYQDIPFSAQNKAVQAIHGYVKDMTKEEYHLYSLRLILGDEISNIKDGKRTEENLPFGFKSIDEIYNSYEQLEEQVEANPKVKQAIEKRKKFQKDLAEELVEYGILGKQVLESDEYFHHQVLKYWNAKEAEYKGVNSGSTDARSNWRPWMAQRKDSPLDYNTEYVEAELTATAQMLEQVEKARKLKKIRQRADISKQLKEQAKEQNYEAVRLMFEDLAEQGLWPQDPETGRAKDPFLDYNQKIAMGFSKLKQLHKKGTLEVEDGFEDFIQSLNSDRETFHPQTFQFLTNQINNKYSGAQAAATIYKGIKERDAFVKESLGKHFKTDTEIIPQGYVKWVPNENKGWFKTNTIAEKVLSDVLSGEKKLHSDDVKQVYAKGVTPYWIIPEGLADTMDNFRISNTTGWWETTSKDVMQAWKQYILLNPLSVVKYNVNNLSGDIDIILASNPGILKYVKNAWKDTRKWMKHQKNEELDRAMELAVINSGFSIQEVDDTVKYLGANSVLNDVILDKKPSLKDKYWAKSRGLTTARENTLRLAAFRYFKDQYKKGKNDNYGVSHPEEIDALVEAGMKEEAAGKLARELLGDYGNLSRHGEHIRRHMAPFYSWMEINAPRYYYLLKNLKHGGGSASGKTLKAATMVGMKGAKFALFANLMGGAITLLNMLRFPDDEEEFHNAKRGQLHLLLYKTDDGEMRSIRIEGALSDALSWFGLEDIASDVKDVASGSATIADKAEEAGKAFANRWIQSVRPDVKTSFELLTGRAMYPDAFSPRPIRDKLEHVLGTVKMKMPYRWIAGKPKRGGDEAPAQLAEDLLGILTYTTDPGIQSYYEARSKVYDWREKNDIESGGGGDPTRKSNALYYYKQAMKYGDLKSAKKYIEKYAELGGTRQGIKQSIRMAHPLSALRNRDRNRFLQELTPAEKDTLKKAIKWYQKTYTN